MKETRQPDAAKWKLCPEVRLWKAVVISGCFTASNSVPAGCQQKGWFVGSRVTTF
jgi:hypothetical protein